MYEYKVSIDDEQAYREMEYWYSELKATNMTLRNYKKRIVDSETEEFYNALLEQKATQEKLYKRYLSELLHIEITPELIISFPLDYFQEKKIYIVSPFEISELKN